MSVRLSPGIHAVFSDCFHNIRHQLQIFIQRNNHTIVCQIHDTKGIRIDNIRHFINIHQQSCCHGGRIAFCFMPVNGYMGICHFFNGCPVIASVKCRRTVIIGHTQTCNIYTFVKIKFFPRLQLFCGINHLLFHLFHRIIFFIFFAFFCFLSCTSHKRQGNPGYSQ